MKIEIILDLLRQWLIEQNPENEVKDIFLFCGINIVIRYLKVNGTWEVKIQECSRCGECCSLMTGKSFPFSTEEGCKYLEKSGNEYLCGLSYFRPNGCAVAEMNLQNCTVVWEVKK